MAGYQKVTILGRLGQQPELTYAAGGMAICKFSMATSKKKKNGEEITSWHRLIAFGKTGETISKYVEKGHELLVEGELSYGSYDKDGVKVYTTDVIVNMFTFVSGQKKSGQSQQNQGGYQNQSGGQAHGYQNQGQQSGPQSGGDPSSEIPF